ncbi:MAG: VOC family protein [Bacteroidetes bacterium]|nr:VOC family protein [Bacteroidota bacterium]
MDQRLTMLSIGVKDLDIATDFYETKFEWRKHKSSNKNAVFFKLNGFMLSLYQIDELSEDATVDLKSSRYNSVVLVYNAESKKEVDELTATLRDRRVTIIKEPEKASRGRYSSYVADPEGNLWEIVYNRLP